MAGSNGELIRVLGLGELFSLPLIALIEADAQAAIAAAEFIADFGFEAGSSAGDRLGPLRTFSFSYERVDETGETRSHVVKIPLISLVPLPLLSVKEAKFNFGVDIFGAVEKPDLPEGTGTTVARLSRSAETTTNQQEGKPKDFLASISRDRTRPAGSGNGSQSVSLRADIDVSIQMKPSDMPTGLAHFLALTGEGTIDRLESEYRMDVQVEGSLDLADIGAAVDLNVVLTDRQGKGLAGQLVEFGVAGGSGLEVLEPAVRTNRNGRAAAKVVWQERIKELPATRTLFVHGVVRVAEEPVVHLTERFEVQLGT